MANYTAYIDESGDLGMQRGTRWFVISAVVVKKSDEQSIKARIKEIKAKLNINEIHFKNIREFNKRAYIAKELSSEKFCYINVLVDTNLFDKEKIPTPLIAYNFICKYLLQRISMYLSEMNESADIVLSARGTSRDGELISYITNKLLTYPESNVDRKTIGNVFAKTSGEWDLLQLADVCATSTFLAYEEHKQYGFCTPCFYLALQDHLYRKDGKLMSYGIKFFQKEMMPNLSELRQKRICAKKERTPSATTT